MIFPSTFSSTTILLFSMALMLILIFSESGSLGRQTNSYDRVRSVLIFMLCKITNELIEYKSTDFRSSCLMVLLLHRFDLESCDFIETGDREPVVDLALDVLISRLS